MKFATIEYKKEVSGALYLKNGFIPMEDLNEAFGTTWPTDFFSILTLSQFDEFLVWYNANYSEICDIFGEKVLKIEDVSLKPLYEHPRKIWGIGLNYRDHAEDLAEKVPTGIPASFMKSDTTIIGYGDTIKIPVQSMRTTGEAELGLIIKKQCKNLAKEDWKTALAGYTTTIDMTAEDILAQNPRYLTVSKNFDTFFSFGPIFYSWDEIDNPNELSVATVKNGKVHAENRVANMTFPPDFLISFHSEVMTLLPGDIISTGTPRAVKLEDGDEVECRITGFFPLKNSVQDLKKSKKNEGDKM